MESIAMKKTYISPVMETINYKIGVTILAGSGGMGNNEGRPGNEYNGGDESYGRGDGYDW